CQKYNDSPYSF
nr:immunoglobulin light chain junction region [Macaca mulatta]MOW62091.1 immunoglobulin light chain junction region [Macaca mulatta]MOW62148.1 immunoglobulin light chain junction region [Macaca mulatta]MOW62780.1 immunoglobulin light chain junction region [Macaca mulatta]MOW62910.1 immunoglobulin light chain junction region [Macaca mulatta]